MNFKDLSQTQRNEYFNLFYNEYNSIILQYIEENKKNLPFVWSFGYDKQNKHPLKLFGIKPRGSGFLVTISKKSLPPKKFFPSEIHLRIIKTKKKKGEYVYFIKPYISPYYNKKLPWQEITKEQFSLLNQIYNVTILPSCKKDLISVLINIKNELI
jgi:hypothetical protein